MAVERRVDRRLHGFDDRDCHRFRLRCWFGRRRSRCFLPSHSRNPWHDSQNACFPVFSCPHCVQIIQQSPRSDGTPAGLAALTMASRAFSSTAVGSGTRTRTTSDGIGDPGGSLPGVSDQLVPPFSEISGTTPVYSATLAATLLPPSVEVRGVAHQPSPLVDCPVLVDDRACTHEATHFEEILGRQVWVQVRGAKLSIPRRWREASRRRPT